jgi:hypothetical protein
MNATATPALHRPSSDATPPAPSSRILNVVRLHLANPRNIVVMPLLILATIFLVNLSIWWIVLSAIDDPATRAEASEGFGYNGATTFIFVYMMVVAVMSMNQTFNFALGMSITRREYYLGTSLTFVVLSAFFTAVLTLAAALETATSGWGVSGRMFTAVYFGDDSWWQRSLVYLAAFLFFFFFGAAVATIYVRWKATGLTIFFVVLAFSLVGLVALVTFTDSWPTFGQWFVDNGAIGAAAWSLPVTALSAVAGYLLLRRATPRG